MNDISRSKPERGAIAKREFLAAWTAARDTEDVRPGDLDVCPYPGLRSFRPSEADLFYGRDSQIKDLQRLLADHNIIFVMGGSGSGKSSLVRGGLVPKLNSTAPIPERVGAWYVVEFRPKLDPVTELFGAILSQLILPVMAVPQAGEAAGGEQQDLDRQRDRARRIGALNAAFNLDCGPDASDKDIREKCRERLQEVLFEGNVIDVGALFDFVEDRLKTLDEALSGGAVSGAPNLLLLIDQFEEVFKPKVDPAGRDMIMSLITSIHTYKPFNLFLIVTMRSEELHRCAEFLGVTEVVNSSLYLVDLIGGRDIEQAIVGPARRVLKSWDIDIGVSETGPFTEQALGTLRHVFDGGREVLPHPADQLPLMQHLLPLVWDHAVGRWQADPDDHPFQIDLADIRTLPGWSSPEGPLVGTLNARANDVLQRAIDAGVAKTKLDAGQVRQLLRVGFCCLAQLDDRGNVVRDFATLSQMLEAAGMHERQPHARRKCRAALRVALGVFQRASLINVGRIYDVNHEALIRGWNTYKAWLDEARGHVQRLVSVDREIAGDQPFGQSVGPLWRLWKNVNDYIFVQKFATANRIAGDETSAELQDVLGPKGAFSEHWARQVLARADAASGNANVRVQTVGERLEAVKRTIDDAIRFRSGVRNRPIWIFMGLVALTALIPYFLWVNATQGDLNEQFRFFRLQTEATAPPPIEGRSLADDREVYAALQLGLNYAAVLGQKPVLERAAAWVGLDRLISSGNLANVSETTGVFRTSLRQLDQGARRVLSDVSVRIWPKTHGNLAQLQEFPASCAIVDPEGQAEQLSAKQPGSLGVELRPEVISGGVKIVAMYPIRHTSDRQVHLIGSSDFAGQALQAGALVCLSHDANWFLIWRSVFENQKNEPPYLQRIVWIRTSPNAVQDGQWRAELKPQRSPTTSETWTVVQKLNEEYSQLNHDVRNRKANIRSFRSNDRVGFLIALKNDQSAILWTSTGLVDPVPVDVLPEPVVPCEFERKSQTSRKGERKTIMHCEMGPIPFDGLDHFLRAEYETCNLPDGLCSTKLAIDYKPRDRERDSTRVIFPHDSAKIEAAAIWDDFLWVRDANGQIWRYLVGLPAIKKLLEERWKNIDEAGLRNVTFSDACEKANCDKMDILGWPPRQKEAPR